MSNNILEPIPASLNDYLLKYNKTTLSNTTPAALPSTSNVTFQKDGFGNISACVAAGGGSSITLETNSVANSSQTTLNLQEGANITLTDLGSGIVAVVAKATGTAGQIQMANSAGTFVVSSLTDNGTTVSTTESLSAVGNISSSTGSLTAGANVVAANQVVAPNIVSTSKIFLGANTDGGGTYSTVVFNGAPTATTDVTVAAILANGLADPNVYFNAPTGGSYNLRTVTSGSLSNALTVSNTLVTANNLALAAATATTSANAGSASALPALPAGYITISINGTPQKIAFFNV